MCNDFEETKETDIINGNDLLNHWKGIKDELILILLATRIEKFSRIHPYLISGTYKNQRCIYYKCRLLEKADFPFSDSNFKRYEQNVDLSFICFRLNEIESFEKENIFVINEKHNYDIINIKELQLLLGMSTNDIINLLNGKSKLDRIITSYEYKYRGKDFFKNNMFDENDLYIERVDLQKYIKSYLKDLSNSGCYIPHIDNRDIYDIDKLQDELEIAKQEIEKLQTEIQDKDQIIAKMMPTHLIIFLMIIQR